MNIKIYLLDWEKYAEQNKKDMFKRITIGIDDDSKIDFNSYAVAYEYSIPEAKNISDVLEDTFRKFNMEHPGDYKNRSLCVGDIVMIDEDFYCCQMTGFKKISESNLLNFATNTV